MSGEFLCTDDCVENVIRFYSDMVYRLAFARTGNSFDADEIYQEVFLRYIRKRPVFKEEEHRKAWLIRVTINCCKKFWGSAWQRKTGPLKDEIVFEASEDAELFQEILRLPPNYREVIHLFYYEEMSVEEISRTLNRKSSTVRTQLTRARAKLKQLIKEDSYV